MNDSFAGACLADYEDHIEKVNLPDPNDRHVLAAAIKSGSSFIITNNLRDFPSKNLSLMSIKAISPDDFIECLILEDGLLEIIIEALATQRKRLKRPAIETGEFIEIIKQQGLKKLADRLTARVNDL